MTLKATVTGSGLTPTGTVNFDDGSGLLGTGTLSNGLAAYSTSALLPGLHSITARYGGDSNYIALTSAVVNLTVNRATPSATLTASASVVAYGAPVTFTVTLTGSGLNKPIGTVTFFNGSISLGTGTLNSKGVATLVTGKLPAGKDSVTAHYPGDNYYSATTSSPVGITVNQATQTIDFTPLSKTVTYGVSPLTLSATATSGLAVTFSATGPATVGGDKLTITGAGTVVVTAKQAGNGNYSPATPVSQTIVVAKAAPAVKLTSSASSVAQGKSVTFTATLTGSGAKPTGTVTFLDGAAKLGTGTLNGVGVATFATAKLTVGKHSFAASYGGNGNYLTAVSSAIVVTVTAP